ncbi:hypothetical protein [Hyphobacterium sp.]|uniref:hypothetical protein n=1 Tax=Hyphobacterium sp. TaxID=2004662 RepID=UPI003748C792
MKPNFDVGKALGFAFEVIRARPRAFVTLAVWTIVYGAALSAFQLQAAGDEMAAYMEMAMGAGGTVSDSEQLRVTGDYISSLLPFMGIALVLGVLFECAWLRLFVRGQDDGIFPFRIGRDEGVFALTGLLLGLIMFGAILLVSIAAVIITALFAAAGPAGAMLAGSLVVLVIFVLTGAIMTLFSPVLALGILKGRISIGAGIQGARRIFWPLLGSFIVAIALSLIAYGLFVGVIGVMPFDQTGQMESGQTASWPLLFVFYAIVQLIYLAPALMMRGIASYAALQIDESNRPLADTFS